MNRVRRSRTQNHVKPKVIPNQNGPGVDWFVAWQSVSNAVNMGLGDYPMAA